MIHDFEEIIFIKGWRKKYATALQNSNMKKKPYADFRSTTSFSIAVEVIFILLSLISLLSCIFDHYIFWYGIFFAFTFHFVFGHFTLCIRFGHYVPGVLTSALFLPLCGYILYASARFLETSTANLIFSCLTGTILLCILVIIMHKAEKPFDEWLTAFATNV